MDVLISHADGISRIEFNRPHKKNALTAAMYGSLARTLAACETDPNVRVVLLCGQTGTFTAGNDLDDFNAEAAGGTESPALQFIRQLRKVTKPVVAAVGGIAVGIGTTMLFHCDLVYASESARFSLPFARLGLCPEAASSYLIPAAVGHQRAAEKLLLGATFDAVEATEMGFVNKVLADDALLDHAIAQAKTLASLPSVAVCATKALLRNGSQAVVDAQLERESELFRQLLAGPAAHEAMTAFREKRKSDFRKF
ncbi:MAG: enoyl-CoA hydratase [Rhizobacter sp.]|nr:enoyl-CoA hydratase [Rhizobacter sp.]